MAVNSGLCADIWHGHGSDLANIIGDEGGEVLEVKGEDMNKYNLSNDNNYRTPQEFYDKLNNEFKFDFDPCPYFEGEITDENDGLLKDWGNSNFINPPYTKDLKNKFTIKAIEEAKKGKTCVMLLPVCTSTKLYHDYIVPNATEIRFIKGRIKFQKLDQKGNWYTPKYGARHDSMVVVFNTPSFN